MSSVASIYDEADALRFESFLSRSHPEYLEDEDLNNSIMQQVEATRQLAAQRGTYLKRVDAFHYVVGQRTLKPPKTKKGNVKNSTTAQAAEAQRKIEADAAIRGSGNRQEDHRITGAATIQAIREKSSRGERMTPQERVVWKDCIASQGSF